VRRSFFTLAFSVIAAAFAANAQGVARQSGEQENVVLIAFSDEKEAFESIVQAVRGQLSDLPVGFQVIWIDNLSSDFSTQEETARQMADDNDAKAVFWCDLSRTDKMYLYVAVPELDRVLVRRLEGSGPGGTSETIAIIARTSIESMLKGASSMDDSGWETSVEKAAAAEAAQTPPEPPKIDAKHETGQSNRFAVEAAYAIDIMSSEHPAVHGFYLALDIYLAAYWHVFAGYVFFSAVESLESDVKLVLKRHPILVGARYIWPIKRFEFGGIVTASIDYLTENISELSYDEDLTVSEDGAETSVSIVPQIYLGFRIISGIRIFGCIGADIPLRKTDYLIADGAVRQDAVFSSWAVRPVGRLGVSAGFL
jgi:hypothetical protein